MIPNAWTGSETAGPLKSRHSWTWGVQLILTVGLVNMCDTALVRTLKISEIPLKPIKRGKIALIRRRHSSHNPPGNTKAKNIVYQPDPDPINTLQPP